MEKQAAEAAAGESRALEAERQKVALSSRVASLEGLKAQLEQQLRLEREVSEQELEQRQQAEQSLAEEGRELAATRDATARAEAALRENHDELQRVRTELEATDARLTVANEQDRHTHVPPLAAKAYCSTLSSFDRDVGILSLAQGLQLQVDTASTEEALHRQKELRNEDQVENSRAKGRGCGC